MNWGCAIGLLFFQINRPFIACMEFPNDAPHDHMLFHAAGGKPECPFTFHEIKACQNNATMHWVRHPDFDLEPSEFASNHRQLLSYFEVCIQGNMQASGGHDVSDPNLTPFKNHNFFHPLAPNGQGRDLGRLGVF